MSGFMLSFTTGKPIAQVYDDSGKIVHVIRVREDTGGQPDIITEDIFDILSPEDIHKISRNLKLSRIENQFLINSIKKRSSANLNDKLKDAYDMVMDSLNNKLKRELEFDKNMNVIPVLGYNDVPFDRHIFISGASNSGKSYLIGNILKYDKRKRPILLLSKLEDDPAYSHIIDDENQTKIGGKILATDNGENNKKKKKNTNKRMIQFDVRNKENLSNLPQEDELKTDDGVIVVFDDIDRLSPDTANLLHDYQDDLLETGRKSNISVISATHKIRDYSRTKTNLSEAEYIVLFPSTNQILSNSFLKDALGLMKKERDYIIKKAAKNSYMIIKTSSPTAIYHEKGIILI